MFYITNVLNSFLTDKSTPILGVLLFFAYNCLKCYNKIKLRFKERRDTNGT